MNVFDLYAKLSLDSSEYDKGLDSAKSAGSKLGSGLATAAKVGMAAVGAATTAVVGFGAASVKTGMSFDSSMSQVAATMGTTVDQIDNLRNFAQEMGRTTAFSATQAADALNYMALAGYDADTSMEMLPNVLNLAAAGSMDLARASDMVTDTQTAFGISLERTSQMVDEMAKAASTGNTSVEQLGDAFLTVGGLAQELNGGMVTLADGTMAEVDGVQELEIALTAMANAGIKGSEAGTHMRNMLLKLSSPTDAGAQALEAMGVAVFDTEGKMRSLSDVFGDLTTAMDTMTQEEKIQTISDLFNTRDLASAEALLNAVGQDWDSIGASILDAEGAASAMAKTQLNNLAGDVTLFKSALEGAQIAISDVLSPSLREFVQFGTNGLSKLTAAFQEGGLEGAMETFGTILSNGLNMIISKLPDAVSAGMKLLGALGQGILDNLDVIIDAAVQIAEQLLRGIIRSLPKLLEGGMQMVSGIMNGIAQMLPELIPFAVSFLMQFVTTLYDNMPLLLEAGMNLLNGLIEGILNGLPVFIAALSDVIPSIVNYLINSIPILINGAIQLVNGIVQAIPQIIEALIYALPDIIQAIIDGLITGLPLLIQGLVQLTLAIVAALPEIIQALVDAIPEIITTIVNTIIENGPQFLNAITSIGQSILQLLITLGTSFVETVKTNLTTLINNIQSFLSQLPEKFAYYAGRAIGEFIKFFLQLPSRIIQIFNNIMDKVRSFGENMKNRAAETAQGFGTRLINGLLELPSKLIEVGHNIVEGLWNGIQNGWGGLIDKVKGLADKLVQGIKDSLRIESPSKVFKWIGQMIDEGLAIGITSNLGVVDDAMASMISATDFPLDTVQVGMNGDISNGGIYSGGFVQNLTINSPRELNPSETARLTRNANREMVLKLRTVG